MIISNKVIYCIHMWCRVHNLPDADFESEVSYLKSYDVNEDSNQVCINVTHCFPSFRSTVPVTIVLTKNRGDNVWE